MKISALGETGATSRTQLTRQRVVAAAVELADSDGTESISMRRLAQELGVEAMSLYTHVRNKDDLLDGMADAVISQIPLSAGGAGWKTALRHTLAHRIFLLRPVADGPRVQSHRREGERLSPGGGDSGCDVCRRTSRRFRPSASISASMPYSADRSRTPVSTVWPPCRRGTMAGNADSIVAPRCPSIRIVYRAGPGSMPPWLRAGR
jgi:AcrR family transcriptional regulator